MTKIKITSDSMPDVIYNAYQKCVWVIWVGCRVSLTDQSVVFLYNGQEFLYSNVDQHVMLAKWLACNTKPAHTHGYNEQQVQDILAKIGYKHEDFEAWMHGQTVICDADGKSIVAIYDLHRFINYGPNAVIID